MDISVSNGPCPGQTELRNKQTMCTRACYARQRCQSTTVFFHPMPVFILVARSVGKSAQHSKLKLRKENRCAIFV
ncbi:hypothetical protein OUZ56_008158 [Daphnia magna]|uniref:Uncharacterized protein n=1 Tax=Daphnia magna TaxID=35525 RepID=A0ABR0AC60_9CRUS|nr:hypothetical protein OUZ56_008158 [Daphnia magna]